MDNKKNILIIDDDKIEITILENIFSADYNVLKTFNGAEALDIIRKNETSISAIILDIHMPVMDGFGFLEERSKNNTWKDIPVIVLTVDDEPDDEIKALDAGADDYVKKPFDSRLILRRVRNLIRLCNNTRISGMSKEEQSKKLAAEKFVLLMEHSNVILFDYDAINDTLTFHVSKNDSNIKENVINNYINHLPHSNTVHPESVATVKKCLREMLKKPMSGTFDFVGDCFGKGYCWNRAKYVSYADDSGKVFRVVGRVDSVQDEYDAISEMKKREKKLIKLAEHDKITGFLNRAATEKRVSAALLIEKLSAFSIIVMIDVDNFKKINDNLGHLAGDSFLKHITSIIKSHCRPTDITGRVGGDEFIVLFRGVKNINVIFERLNKIEEEINLLAGEFNLEKTSVSFGVAKLAPRTENFKSAFDKADKALYMAKASGKNCYHLYNEINDGGICK